MASLNPFTALAQEGEPAINTSRAVALVAAVIALVTAFGLPLDDKQTLAIIGLVTIAAPLVQGYLTRRKVTPADQVAAKLASPGSDIVVAGPALENIDDGAEVQVFADDDPEIAEL